MKTDIHQMETYMKGVLFLFIPIFVLTSSLSLAQVKSVNVDFGQNRIRGYIPFDEPFYFVGKIDSLTNRVVVSFKDTVIDDDADKFSVPHDWEQDKTKSRKFLFEWNRIPKTETDSFAVFIDHRLSPNKSIEFNFELLKAISSKDLSTARKEFVNKVFELLNDGTSVFRKAMENNTSLTTSDICSLSGSFKDFIPKDPEYEFKNDKSPLFDPDNCESSDDFYGEHKKYTDGLINNLLGFLQRRDNIMNILNSALDEKYDLFISDHSSAISKITSRFKAQIAGQAPYEGDANAILLLENFVAKKAAIKEKVFYGLTGIEDPVTKTTPDLDEIIRVDDIKPRLEQLKLVSGQIDQMIDYLLRVKNAQVFYENGAAAYKKIIVKADLSDTKIESISDSLLDLKQHGLQPLIDEYQTMLENSQKMELAVAKVASGISKEAKQHLRLSVSNDQNFDDRTRNYISLDLGFAYLPAGGIEQINTYYGLNFYLRPVNKKIPLSKFHGSGFANQFSRRFSFMIGLSPTSISQEGRRSDLFADQNLMTGCGVRLGDYCRLNTGALWFKHVSENPLKSSKSITSTPFLSLSLDVDVASLYNNFFNGLFSNFNKP